MGGITDNFVKKDSIGLESIMANLSLMYVGTLVLVVESQQEYLQHTFAAYKT